MVRIGRITLLFLAVIVAACTEGRKECGPTSSCAPVPDLDVTSVTIGPVVGTHPVTGRGVVDSLLVTFTVRNSGKVATAATTASVTVPLANQTDSFDEAIPMIEPGQSVTVTTRVTAVRNFFDWEWHRVDTVTAHVQVISPDTTIDRPANNSRDSEIYHFARPILEVVPAPVADPHVRVNGPLHLSVTITNHSAVATARNIQLRHCLWDFDVACWAGQWTAFGTVPLPDIGPGESHTVTYTTSISTTGFEEGYLDYGLSVCVTARTDTAAYMQYNASGAWGCEGVADLEVWPDYEACNPPVLGTHPATLLAPNCGYYPVPPDEPGSNYYRDRYRRKLYYVFALDAVAGKTYTVTGLPPEFVDHTGRAAPDQDPAPNRVSFSYTGRFYLRVYDWQGVRTVSVTETTSVDENVALEPAAPDIVFEVAPPA